MSEQKGIVELVEDREKSVSPDANEQVIARVKESLGTAEREVCPPEVADVTDDDVNAQLDAMADDDKHKVLTTVGALEALRTKILAGDSMGACNEINDILIAQAEEDLI